MPVNHVASSGADSLVGNTSRTYAFDRGAGSTVVVRFSYRDNDTQRVSNVTYGGQAMTEIYGQYGGFRATSAWILVNAPSGSNNVSFNVSPAANSLVSCATSYSGVDPANPTRAVEQFSANGVTSVSRSVVSGSGDLCLFTIASNTDVSASVAAQANEVIEASGAVGETCYAFGREAGVATATTVGATWTPSVDMRYAAFALRAAAASGDYAVDFDGAANENPWVETGWGRVAGTGDFALTGNPNTVLTCAASGGGYRFYTYTGLPADGSGVMEAKAELAGINGGDVIYIGVLDGSGNGYVLDINYYGAGTWAVLRSSSAYTLSAIGSAFDPGVTIASGDIISVRVTKGAGSQSTINLYKNGTLFPTNGTFSNRTEAGALGTLRPGIGLLNDNSNLSSFRSFAVDGVGGAPLVKKLKVLVHPSAASASGVEGIVFEDTAGIATAEIGEFTGKTFEATTEGSGASERAVLKVPVADFGGGSLAVNDTVNVVVRNTTHTTGIIPATIIEE